MAVASDGTVYVTDSTNAYVDKLTPQGLVTHVAGNGTTGNTGDNGLATSAALNSPNAVALDEANGILYIAQGASTRSARWH
jgi:sugar lactone lactonase YvrE